MNRRLFQHLPVLLFSGVFLLGARCDPEPEPPPPPPPPVEEPPVDPCAAVRCAGGFHCVAHDGQANCVADEPDEACVITGCSGQVCSNEAVFTTCEFRPEYACYGAAECAVQPDGRCGWTLTPALDRCLIDAGDDRERRLDADWRTLPGAGGDLR